MEISARQETRKPFLFLTGAEDFSTFRLTKAVGPYNYLIKPFNKPELQYAIELALERYHTEVTTPPASNTLRSSKSVFIKRGNTLVCIQYDEIKYIEVDGKYSKIVCYNQKFVVQQPLVIYIQPCRLTRSYLMGCRHKLISEAIICHG